MAAVTERSRYFEVTQAQTFEALFELFSARVEKENNKISHRNVCVS